MRTISAGNINIPVLGFGTWQLKGAECRQSVSQALEVGYTHIDTAQIYENEEEVGEAWTTHGSKRDDLFLTTKVWLTNMGEGDVAPSVETSLRKLKSSYVDLLLVHWPPTEMHWEVPLRQMVKLLDEGKTRAIGVSNFTSKQLAEAKEAFPQIVCDQVEYHAFLSQEPVLNILQEDDMFLTAYSPLGQGKAFSHPDIVSIAEKHGTTASRVALRYLIEQENVVAIPRSSSREHIRDNFDIFSFSLDEEDKKRIDALPKDERIVNPDFAPAWDNVG